MLYVMRARGGGKTQAMRETGVPMMLANGGVVNATKKAGRWSAISHARESHAGPGRNAHAGQGADAGPGSETHTTTHTRYATACDCVTCNGCRWLHEPEARRQGADAGSDEGARGGVRGRMVVS